MKILSADLLQAVGSISPAIKSGRTTLPILSYAQIHAAQGRFLARATDLDATKEGRKP